MVLSDLTPAQYSAFVALWNQRQVNGYIGKNEIKADLFAKGITNATQDELQQVIDSISVDPKGITFQAYIDYVSAAARFRDLDSEYREAFRIYDRSGAGELSREDIAYVMGKVGLTKDLNMDEMFDILDANKDGKIQYDEFVALMAKRF